MPPISVCFGFDEVSRRKKTSFCKKFDSVWVAELPVPRLGRCCFGRKMLCVFVQPICAADVHRKMIQKRSVGLT